MSIRLDADKASSGGGAPSGPAGGDLGGTYPNPTVATVGTSTAANIHTAELAANAATSANTPSTIVKRDGSGNFSAGTITASLSGNATTATDATSADGLTTATTTVSVSSATAPTAGQVLTATSSTAADWETPAASGAAGADGSVQFAESGAFTADTQIVWDNSAKALGVGTPTPAAKLHVFGQSSRDFGVYNTPILAENTSGGGCFIEIFDVSGLPGLLFNNNGQNGWFFGSNNTADLRVGPMPTADQSGLGSAKDGASGLTVLITNGFVGVQNTAPAFPLDVTGNINTSAGYYSAGAPAIPHFISTAASPASGLTTYVWSGAVNATESLVATPMPRAGVVGNLFVTPNTATAALSSCTVTVRINGSDTGLTVTFNAGEASTLSDTDPNHYQAYAAGDKIDLAITSDVVPPAVTFNSSVTIA